jgi:hypothetical protein
MKTGETQSLDTQQPEKNSRVRHASDVLTHASNVLTES